MADNLTTSMCPLSSNVEALTSWNPVGLPRPVMALLYLFLGKAILFQAWTGLQGSRRLRLPDLKIVGTWRW